MSVKIGTEGMGAVNIGSTPIERIYIGTQLVFQGDLYEYTGRSLSTTGTTVTPKAASLINGGLRLYILDSTGIIYQYNLSTAWEIDTATYSNNSYDTGLTSFLGNMSIESAGGIMLISHSLTDVQQFLINDFDDISLTTNTGSSLDASSETSVIRAAKLSPNKLTLNVLDNTNDRILKYNLSIAGDINSATYSSTSFSLDTSPGDVDGFVFTDSGGAYFAVGQSSDNVFKRTLTDANDILTSSTASKMLRAKEAANQADIWVSSDETHLYILDSIEDEILEYVKK
jgi:hypothetical protein